MPGEAGLSHAYEARASATLTVAPSALVSMVVPAGGYVVTATVSHQQTAGGSNWIECDLSLGTRTVTGRTLPVGNDTGFDYVASDTLQLATSTTEPGPAQVTCRKLTAVGAADATIDSTASIIAIAVGAVG